MESTYPNVSQLLNISPATCVIEVSSIKGISEERRKAFGVNLTGGRVNSVQLATEYFNAPTLDQLLKEFTDAA